MSSEEPPAKSSTANDFKTTQKTEDRGYCFPISSGRNERRCTVSKFKGKVRVDIREYYQDESGEMRPGKRGLSLSAEEWQKLESYVSLINEAIDELSGK